MARRRFAAEPLCSAAPRLRNVAAAMFVGGQSSREKGEKYEAHAHSCSNNGCSNGRSFGLRYQDAAAGADHLSGRKHGSCRLRLPDASAAASAAAGHLPGWIDAAGRLGLPDPAAASAASAAAARRRARLSVQA